MTLYLLLSWFCLEIIGCCFDCSKFPGPKEQPLISKQNRENKRHYSLAPNIIELEHAELPVD